MRFPLGCFDPPEPTQPPVCDVISLDSKYTPPYQRWSNPPNTGKHSMARRQRGLAKKSKRRSK